MVGSGDEAYVDGVIEFFFKYRPTAFARGTLAYAPVAPMWVVLMLALVAVVAAAWSVQRRGVTRRATGAMVLALRTGAIAVLAWCLLRPVLVIAESMTQRNVVAIVIDDSRSMRIADEAGRPRADVVQHLAGGPDSALLRALTARYQTRVHRVSAAGRIASPATLPFDASRSLVLSAVVRTQDELAGAPLAGVVVITDGADNASNVASGGATSATSATSAIEEQLLTLRSRGVPVYPVAVGSERFARDIEIARIEVPRQALRQATVLVEAMVTHRGYGGVTVPVTVEDAGRLVYSTRVTLPSGGDALAVRLRVPVPEPGARELRIAVPVQQGELIAENNARRAVLVVHDRREKILHLEGEPRPELKFARRAVAGDAQLQLVTLLRSAKDKWLRLGVDDSLELASGFPVSRAALFQYKGVVLGSLEASSFTGDQLRMLSDFVSERGGGLLLLGGRAAFAEGGYAGSALSDAMPVEMASAALSDTAPATEITAVPSAAGVRHPALQLAGTDSQIAARWRTLPPLTTVNAMLRPKVGATVLLEGRIGTSTLTRPMLVTQRFGRGRVMAFAAQDSWIWQMHADIAVEDSTHETLWRQSLRWLVSDVPDRVETMVPDDAAPGEALVLRAQVRDSAYLLRNGATVSAVLTAPTGVTSTIPLEWAVDRDGEYSAPVVPAVEGVYEVRMQSVSGRDTTRAPTAFFRVATPVDEYFGAERRTSLLQQVASETGGRLYSAANATDIARDIVYSPSGATRVTSNDLWDMPIIFVLLAGLLGTEWWLRRQRGMA